jgi:hypothetical protein
VPDVSHISHMSHISHISHSAWHLHSGAALQLLPSVCTCSGRTLNRRTHATMLHEQRNSCKGLGFRCFNKMLHVLPSACAAVVHLPNCLWLGCTDVRHDVMTCRQRTRIIERPVQQGDSIISSAGKSRTSASIHALSIAEGGRTPCLLRMTCLQQDPMAGRGRQ